MANVLIHLDEHQGSQVSNEKEVAALDPNLKANKVRSGVVESIGPSGVYVDIGAGPSGLLLKNRITAAWNPPHRINVEDIEKMFSVGDEIKVMVHRVDTERQRFSLSTKSLEDSPGDMVKNPQLVYEKAEEGAAAFLARVAARRQEMDDREKARRVDPNLKVHDLKSGVVTGSQTYGVFVDIGTSSDGLLHSSQISHERVSFEDMKKMFSVGAEIKVMVHEIDNDRQRFSLSTKSLEVNPGDMVKDPQMVYEKAEETASAFRANIAASEQEMGV
eukprot:gene27567-biopygen5892